MKAKRSNLLAMLGLAGVLGAATPGCDRPATAAHLQSATLASFVAQVARPTLSSAVEDLLPEDADARATALVEKPVVREIRMPLVWIYAHAPRPRDQTATVPDDAYAALDRDLGSGTSLTVPEALALGGLPRALPLDHVGDAALPPASVARELRFADDRIQACYATVLRDNPGAHGKINVDFVIGHDGRVREIHEGTSDLGVLPVMPCVANGYAKLRMAPPASRFVEVTRTLSLHG